MTHPNLNTCDENLLNRYLDNDLDTAEKAQVEAHVANCRQCSRQLATLTTFSQDLCDRIRYATDSVDFVALEKQVLNTALRHHHPRGGRSRFVASLKYTIPAAITAGLLLFLAYSNQVLESPPAPSAIINSFTGSMSSVMILETPETRQTILWYNEDTELESEPNAV